FNFPPVNEDRAWAAVAVMREIAGKHGVSVATVALGYVLAKPFVMSVIIGASRMEQLEQNLAATELKLDSDDLARLDEVSALPSEYPGWMLERQAAGRPPAPFAAKK
ncbi:aldo/keto reductase, partial [Mesorhizobium sp.]